MATIVAFTTQEKNSHNSHKFAFTLLPMNYGNWKAMIEHFLVFNNLFGYVDGTITCSEFKVSTGDAITDNPSYPRWICNDAHVHMIIISTISKYAFQHVQGDETPLTYLACAQEYATALANIGEHVKDKDLVLFVISGLHEEYNGLKSTLLARHPPITFIELHAFLSDHDYMINKNIPDVPTSQPHVFTASTETPSPNISNLHSQLQFLHNMASQLGFQLNPIAPQSATP
uniref:Uncharacterized protein n=1 Tax=Lactuca sativa TaxID=4236 RepID=A0A9R1X3T6_LACSA|nr:hypothetical protein LSAT_V11C700345740 [Lactuca sativa]